MWIVKCFCGTDIRGQDENEVVKNAQEHAKNKHALTVTPEQVMGMATQDA